MSNVLFFLLPRIMYVVRSTYKKKVTKRHDYIKTFFDTWSKN